MNKLLLGLGVVLTLNLNWAAQAEIFSSPVVANDPNNGGSQGGGTGGGKGDDTGDRSPSL